MYDKALEIDPDDFESYYNKGYKNKLMWLGVAY